MPPGVTPEANLLSVCELECSGLTIIGFDLPDIGKLELSIQDCLQHILIIADLEEGIGISLRKLDLLSETDNNGLLAILAIYEEESIYRDLLSDDLRPETALLIIERYELHRVGIDAILDCLLDFFVELLKHIKPLSPAFAGKQPRGPSAEESR